MYPSAPKTCLETSWVQEMLSVIEALPMDFAVCFVFLKRAHPFSESGGANILPLCSVLPQGDGFYDVWRKLSTSCHVWRRSLSQRLLMRPLPSPVHVQDSAKRK